MPGLVTQPRYKASGDFQLKIVFGNVIKGW